MGFFILTANCPTAKCRTAKNPARAVFYQLMNRLTHVPSSTTEASGSLMSRQVSPSEQADWGGASGFSV